MDGMDMEYGMYVDFLKKVTHNYPLLNLKYLAQYVYDKA